MQVFRLFVSSPSDAATERRRVENVVSRLNGEFAGLARLEAIRWETEFYRAHATFQTQIPEAAQCDLVVGVLRWRLGLPLPGDFPSHLPDGAPYPSGTAYEILTAIDKRRAGGELPDVFVFRYDGGPPSVRIGQSDAEEIARQWSALGGFFEKWFRTAQGQFKAAFNSYGSEDDFEAQLETLLRKWLAERVSGGRALSWPPTKGSPFRGLNVFGALHAPVFFGRAVDIRRATDLWREAAERSAPFLLIVGASGSGKSSLARAGLIPRLTTPGVVKDVDLWRAAVLCPADNPAGPFAALAEALLQRSENLPPEEAGRGAALPEIAEGDCKTPTDLTPVLAHADAAAVKPVLNALERIAARAKESEKIERAVRCDLVLLVDQLDELFAPSLSEETRSAFAALLAGLVGTGRVWLIATLRADLYASLLATPALKQLKEAGVTYDLAPPGAAELAEIVRAPAEAAGLKFDTDPKSGERLDERLLREADRPDMLPLLQLALSRLWEARESRGDETFLPFAAFEKLGGVKGIVDAAGEAALAGLDDNERAKLAPLIRRLSEVSHGAGLTARAAPLAEAAPDEASKKLVDALVAARLLTLSGEGGAASLRLAHQRVLSDWTRAQKIVANSADFLRVRDEVEEARRRWQAAGRRNDLLIPAGLPLSEAENAAKSQKAELPAEPLAFIKKSSRRARRRQSLTAAVALIFFALAVGAGLLALIANGLMRKAVEAAYLAETATKNSEIRLAAANELLDSGGTTEQLRQCLASTLRLAAKAAPKASRDFFVGRWHVELFGFSADMDWRDDGTCHSNGVFNGGRPLDLKDDVCVWRYEQLADDEFVINYQSKLLGDGFAKRMVFKTVNPTRIQDTEQDYDAFRIVCPERELILDRSELDRLRKLAESDPDNRTYQRALAAALDTLGEALSGQGDANGALAPFEESLETRRKLALDAPDNVLWQRELSSGYDQVGQTRLTLNRNAAALEAFQAGLAVRQKLYLGNRSDFAAQHDFALSLEEIGDTLMRLDDDRKPALETYDQALRLRVALANANPNDTALQLELAKTLYSISKASDRVGATESLNKALAILTTLERDQKLPMEMSYLPGLVRQDLTKLR
jgi:hypothetical protein